VYTVDEHGQSICKVKVKAQVPKLIIGEDGSVTADGEEEKEEEIGVMMGWETGIMKETVRKLTEGHPNEKEGLKVLNVGFGLGIVRFHFSHSQAPSSNAIPLMGRSTRFSSPSPPHRLSMLSSNLILTSSHICAQQGGTTDRT
jgi:hypothetical protein